MRCQKVGEVDLDELQDASFIPKKTMEQTFWVKDRDGWDIFVPDHEDNRSEFVQFQNKKGNYLDYETRRTTIDKSGEHDQVIRCKKFKDGEMKEVTEFK